MKVPGGNLFKIATKVISKQTLQYFRDIGRTTNAVGDDVTQYATSVLITASFQPVSRSIMYNMGLDMQRQYYMLYVAKNVLDIARDISGDHFVYNCKTYQSESKTPWFSADGWDQILCVEVLKDAR